MKLHIGWLERNKNHSGIIVSDQIELGEIVRRLLKLLNRVAAHEVQNNLLWLQAFKP